jgi:prevent-host-death family protein
MVTKIISSDQARTAWRNLLDSVIAGDNVLIERYGKPAAAVIPYQDFLEAAEFLQDLRDTREAQAALEAWRRDPGEAQPWEEVKEELIAERLLDE